jgi:hypothetical protein
MDHVVCLNQNSFPASDVSQGKALFNDALQGVLALHKGEDRFLFYLDANVGTLFDFEIAPTFTYRSFVDESQDNDLKSFLYEVEDKSPALDCLSSDQIDEMAEYRFYLHGRPADTHPDVYSLAWVLSGYLLSLATEDVWKQSEVVVCRVDAQGQFVNGDFSLKNIANSKHGQQHASILSSVNLDAMLDPHHVSDELKRWFDEQNRENQERIVDKLTQAKNRQFDGGEPLFKSLEGTDGLREVRFSAHAGGAVRVIFKAHAEIKYLLWGFIKKSDDEGYELGIRKAMEIFNTLS